MMFNSSIEKGQNIDKGNIKFIDGLRGIAALVVLVGHARWLLWEGYTGGFQKHPQAYSNIDKILMYFFSMFKFGHEMVLLFFVISGFVIHYRYQWNDGDVHVRFKYFQYFKSRLKRLYPPFLLSMFISFFLFSILYYSKYFIFFHPTGYSNIDNVLVFDNSLNTFLGNLIFCMDIYVPVYCGNGPAWSLAYEFWFYAFYPIFWYLTYKFGYLISTSLIVVLFFFSGFTNLIPILLIKKVFSYFFIWWLGVLAAYLFKMNKYKMLTVLSAVSMSLFLFLFFYFNKKIDLVWDLSWGFFFCSILSFLLCCHGYFNMKFRLLSLFEPLGRMSYTVYITHFPILLLMSSIILKYYNSLPINSYFIILGILISLIITYALYILVERRSVKVK